jgi:hypothetical protein
MYSGKDTKLEHAQMQWLYQGAMMHMTLQAEASIDRTQRAHFQMKVPDTEFRIYSPTGFYMLEGDFDHYEQSSYIPTFFAADEYLRAIVSNGIGWTLTDDQAMMLMHLEVIHDNYTFAAMFTQFEHCATHFGLFLPLYGETRLLHKQTKQPTLTLVT